MNSWDLIVLINKHVTWRFNREKTIEVDHQKLRSKKGWVTRRNGDCNGGNWDLPQFPMQNSTQKKWG